MASGSRAVLQICKADGAFRWVYDAASVADEQMLRATQHLLMLLNDAVRAGSHRRTVGELSLVSEEERAQLLQGLNHTVASHTPAACLHRLFEAQVRRTPEAIAVTYGDDSLTYAELNTQANRWAHRLVQLGVQPDSLVALCAGRGLPMLVGLLGILKAGGAYVPLDPPIAASGYSTSWWTRRRCCCWRMSLADKRWVTARCRCWRWNSH